MFKVSFIIRNTNQWRHPVLGSAQGIHILQPGQQDIANAIEKCERDLFETVYIYDTQLTANVLAAAISHYFDLSITIDNKNQLTVCFE